MKHGLKIAVLATALTFAGVGTTYACLSEPAIVAMAEETSITETPETEETTVKDIKNEILKLVDTYIVPLLGGTTITSVVSMVVAILVAVIREGINKKKDQKLAERETAAEEKILAAQKLIADAYAVIGLVKTVFEKINTQISQNEELRKLLETKMSEIESTVVANSTAVEKLGKVEPILKLLVELQGKLTLASDVAIASGVAEDVDKLLKMARDF